jgi:hypothetical protein
MQLMGNAVTVFHSPASEPCPLPESQPGPPAFAREDKAEEQALHPDPVPA